MPQNLEYKREYHTLANIPPRSLRAYAEAQGWRKVATYPGISDVYELNAESPEIRVGTSESKKFVDYPLRMWEAIWALADAENREWSAVLSDLLMSDFDAVRLRWSGDSADGAIPLDAGAALIQGSRDMLLAAACSAQRSKPAFRMGINKKAQSYMQRAQLRQTQRGSFVINIALPVPALPIPVERNTFHDHVVRKLISGLSAVHKAARFAESETDFRDFANEIPSGVSANLCGALAVMLGARAAESVDISVNWALSRSTAREPFAIRFDKSNVETLEGASEFLKQMTGRRAARGRA